MGISEEFMRMVKKEIEDMIVKEGLDQATTLNLDDSEFSNLIRILNREITSFVRRKTEPVKVAFLGPEGSFSHEASFSYFGSFAEYIPVKTNSDVFEEVDKGRVEFGVVAVENSTSGSVSETLDCFLQYDLIIYSEVMLTIHQNLMVKRGTKLEDVKRVYSHPVALEQCRRWLSMNLPNVERIPVSSTSEGAKMVTRTEDSAAIGSVMSAKLNNLEILEERIEDGTGNMTRFLVVGKEKHEPTGRDKTSFMFSVAHEPGSLVRVLNVLADHHINMTKLESRPYPGRRWEYVFFVDVEGHIDEDRLKTAFDEMKKYCLSMKFLGSYPKSIILD